MDESQVSLEKQLAASVDAAAEARAFLRATLHTWQLDGLGEVVELLSSELVSNVVRHVGTGMTMRVGATADRSVLRVEVDDPSGVSPRVRHPQPNESTGRGLLLVDALASRWGVHVRSGEGKTVWFEVDVDTATEEIHGGEG